MFYGTTGNTIMHVLEDFTDQKDACAMHITTQEAGELEGMDTADFREKTRDKWEHTVLRSWYVVDENMLPCPCP